MEKMKTRFLIITVLALVPLIVPNVSAACAAEAMEWWEPCNDAGQNDILSFKATMIIVISAIIVVIIGFVIRSRK